VMEGKSVPHQFSRLARGRVPAESEFGATRNTVQMCTVPPSRGRSVATGGERPAALRKSCALRCVPRDSMKIRSHSESHIVELDDGSRWQIFPGDLDLTLDWKPETDLAVVPIDDEVSSHALIGEGRTVRVIPAGESWSVREVRSVLKDG
jgi:hypothetical protein